MCRSPRARAAWKSSPLTSPEWACTLDARRRQPRPSFTLRVQQDGLEMRFGSTIAVALMGCLLSGPAGAEDWTEFRGPTGQGLSAAKGLPTRWTARENVVWSKGLPGKGWSSPVVLGKRLYLTAAVPVGSDENGTQSLRA